MTLNPSLTLSACAPPRWVFSPVVLSACHAGKRKLPSEKGILWEKWLLSAGPAWRLAAYCYHLSLILE